MIPFNKLVGNWQFSRSITNNLQANLTGKVTGIASFKIASQQNNLLHYVENGQYVIQHGLKFNIQQEYFYVYDALQKSITKYAAQNGLIKDQLYIYAGKSAEHICGKDHYLASYEFIANNYSEFSLIYKVQGPQKSYSSCTKYLKLCED